MTQRCGYVALLGRPNAGKSTLLNSLVGEKIAVVSRKPQTTRNRILGLVSEGDAQIVFLDTPGIHKSQGQRLLNSTMNRVAYTVASDADLLFYLIDLKTGWHPEDATFLERIIKSSSAPVTILATKVDSVRKPHAETTSLVIRDQVQNVLGESLKERIVGEIPMAVSAKRKDSAHALRSFIAERLPEGPWFFGKDDLTDMSEEFLSGELIREQLFRQLGEEIPYGCAVKVTRLVDEETMVRIHADVILTRKTHKPIVLGRQGNRIKSIGTDSRKSLERHFGKKVFLDLHVNVAEGWVDSERLVAELAHIQELEDES